jgi:hypothetical protein
MTNTTITAATRSAMLCAAQVLCAAAALLGTACSGAPDVVAVENGPATSNAALNETGWTDPTVAPADDNHVRVIGMVEAIALDGAPGAAKGPVAGAEVCLTTSGATTCTTTDDDGTYTFEGVEKSSEPAELIATHEGFAATVTSLSVETTASHALGMIAESLMPSGNVGVVLARSLLKAYAMTELVPGVRVDVQVGGQTFSGTTQGDGSTVFTGVAPGPITVHGTANALSCDLWAGSSSATINTSLVAAAGVVTQIDVLCNVDANDKR